MDAEAKVKSDVAMDLKKSILEETKTLHQDLVETRVREAVSAAVNTKAPSQVFSNVHGLFLSLIFREYSAN